MRSSPASDPPPAYYISPVSMVLTPEEIHRRAIASEVPDVRSHGFLKRLSRLGIYRLFFPKSEARSTDCFAHVCTPPGYNAPAGMWGPAVVTGPLLRDGIALFIEAHRVELRDRTYVFT